MIGTLDLSIAAIEKGLWDTGKVPIVDPREEQIAKLEAKLEQVEQAGHRDSADFRQRLAALEGEITAHSDQRVVNPSFDDLCRVLEQWIPRYRRRYEEAYKSELSEHLAHRFLKVREETKGALCDIAVAGQHAIHLKVNPDRGAYDTLCGQILRTLEEFKDVACVIVAAPSEERFQDFNELVRQHVDRERVRCFAKAM